MDNKSAYVLIGIAGSLWGIIGIFVTNLYTLGFTATQIVTVRVITAAILLVLYLLIKNPRLLIIQFSDIKYFIGTGLFSIVIFNIFSFKAIKETSISIAAILLYTAPAFVTLLSRLIFKEPLTKRKCLALVTTLLGCSLVIGVLPGSRESVSLYGLMLGVGSGFFYALYSIFGKFALDNHNSLTVTTYTFVFAAISITPFSNIQALSPLLLNMRVWLYILGLGFLSTVLAYALYTKGLYFIESSRASIIATIEPVVASLVGFLIFNEKLNLWQYSGICLVIAGIIIVQEPSNKSSLTVSTNK